MSAPHRCQVYGGTFRGARSAAGRRGWPDLTPALAAVWLVHGLYNKLLGGSPRHLAIVQSVPGLHGTSGERTVVAVGLAEVGIAVWMLSRRAPRWCAAAQTAMLLSMNVLELTFARPLLLWPAGLLPVNLLFLALVWAASDRSAADLAPSKRRVVDLAPAKRRVVDLAPSKRRTVDLAPAKRRVVDLAPVKRRAADLARSVGAPLRRHPVAVRATLRECVTLTYAVPASALRSLLPPRLELDTVGEDGFVAVALVQTERLRPDGLPPALGGNFFLAGYRVFTRFRTQDGRTLRGLRILRSDTDRTLMALGGNLLTHYNYHRCRAGIVEANDMIRFTVHSPDGTGDLDVIVRRHESELPPGSPFASVRDARRFAGPLPFTFDYEEATHSIVAIEGRRTHWRPTPVEAHVKRLAFLDQPPFVTKRLAAAFYVRDVDYHWLRGVRHAL